MENKTKDYFQYGLASIVIVGFIVLMGLTIFHNMPKANERLIDQLWGAWIMAFSLVLNYFFSSNKDSQKKTEMLYNSTSTLQLQPISLDKTKFDYKEKFGKESPSGKGMFEIQEAINCNKPFNE